MVTKKESLKKAEKYYEQRDYQNALWYYKEVGVPDKEKECWIKLAGEFIDEGGYSSAISIYKNHASSLSEIPQDKLEKVLELVRKGDVGAAQCLAVLIKSEEAVMLYKKNYGSLLEVPEKMRNILLEQVKNGNVTVTQKLADLVKSEEDEIMFNEARAGLVL
jgi:hypothetical protein